MAWSKYKDDRDYPFIYDEPRYNVKLTEKQYNSFCEWERLQKAEADAKKLQASVIQDRDPGDEG